MLVDALHFDSSRSVLLVADGEGDVHVVPAMRSGTTYRRAHAGEGVADALLTLIDSGSTGDFTAELLADSALREVISERRECAMRVDQTNESIIVGDAVVKWSATAESGEHPAGLLLSAMARAGFDATPRPLGLVYWRGRLIAQVTTLVPQTCDGWTWVVDDLRAAATNAPETTVTLGSSLGEVTAGLLVALAHQMEPRTAGADEVAAWGRAADSEFEKALEVSSPADRTLLEAAREPILAPWDAVAQSRTPVLLIHGDLHVGQVLRSDQHELFVVDFDGNPIVPFEQRTQWQSPAADVAGMAQSIVHAGLVLARLEPDLADAAQKAVEISVSTYLATVRDGLQAAGLRDLLDDRLIQPFRLRQVVREFSYAAQHLQRWLYVPRAALPLLLNHDQGRL